jgi:hypothetical protein
MTVFFAVFFLAMFVVFIYTSVPSLKEMLAEDNPEDEDPEAAADPYFSSDGFPDPPMDLLQYIEVRLDQLMRNPQVIDVVGNLQFDFNHDRDQVDGDPIGKFQRYELFVVPSIKWRKGGLDFRVSVPFLGSRLRHGTPARCWFRTEWQYLGDGNWYIKYAFVDVVGYGRIPTHMHLAERIFSWKDSQRQFGLTKNIAHHYLTMRYARRGQALLNRGRKVDERRRQLMEDYERWLELPLEFDDGPFDRRRQELQQHQVFQEALHSTRSPQLYHQFVEQLVERDRREREHEPLRAFADLVELVSVPHPGKPPKKRALPRTTTPLQPLAVTTPLNLPITWFHPESKRQERMRKGVRERSTTTERQTPAEKRRMAAEASTEQAIEKRQLMMEHQSLSKDLEEEEE